MSVYSGFATRNQQKYYDKVLYNLISTLMVRIVKFYKSQHIDEKAFKKIVKQQHKVLNKMQKHKYLDPKYGELLAHFMKVLQKNIDQQQNNHLQFQLRRKSIQQQQGFSRTLSVLGNQLHQLKNFTEKIDTLEFDDLNSQKDLYKIPQKKQVENISKSKKKKKKQRNNSIKSNIDIWEVRRQKLPSIPNLQPIQQAIMNKTRFLNNYSAGKQASQKNTNRTMDEPTIQRNQNNVKVLAKAPKFRSKMYFK